MRRIAVLLVGLSILSAGPVSAAVLEPYGGAEQMAVALWIERDGSHGTMYMAFGSRGVDTFAPGEFLPGYGAVGKGPCHFGKHGGWCMARGRGKSLGPDRFSVDPLLASAHMSIESGGFTHVIDWTGKGTIPETQGSQSIGEGHHASAAMFRMAPATGKLFGNKMTGHREFHFLVNGAYASSGLGRYVRFLPNGMVQVRIRVPSR